MIFFLLYHFSYFFIFIFFTKLQKNKQESQNDFIKNAVYWPKLEAFCTLHDFFFFLNVTDSSCMLTELVDNFFFFLVQEFATVRKKPKANSTEDRQEGSLCLQSPFRFA